MVFPMAKGIGEVFQDLAYSELRVVFSNYLEV